MREHALQNAIRNALAGNCLAFRANVGQAWTGECTRLPNGDLLIRNPRPFTTGLPPGFSDLFGLVPVVITPDMVGGRFARFFALEIKTPTGRVQPRQEAFLRAVNDNGGLSGVARSADDALAIIQGAHKGK
ncbi:VRR-NUC domain-containing protein [Microvirga alba]|uniref:VRR-NUC domain-containing protein n=1 Tax=Microvirga alba TaxID=2791025 RepID=A0A931BVN2_9HYPH|nr:VRR-NUC domain-containing protein [Microvirga alba]MBF9235559.1 VRR-NUC domain-containing protein [Microvirga alba]